LTEKPGLHAIPEIVDLSDMGTIAATAPGSQHQTAWKFVLIRRDRQTHLVLGPVSLFRYHANLVDAFCNRYAIPASKAKGTQKVEIYDRSVKVLGGGQINVNPEARLVRFYGQSTAYGPYDSDTVSAILERGTVFSGYSVLVD
jgi:hypothetical protein